MKISKLILIALGVSLVAGHAWAAPYVILKDGTRVEGTQIRALPNGNINLQVGAGMRSFPKGSYIKAVADQPAEFDRGMAAMKAKKYDEAVKLFEGVVSRYRMLDWDIQAGRQLAEARLAKGDAEGAVKAYEQLFASHPAERQNADSAWGMRRAMLAAKQYSALTKQLDVVAASGSRARSTASSSAAARGRSAPVRGMPSSMARRTRTEGETGIAVSVCRSRASSAGAMRCSRW